MGLNQTQQGISIALTMNIMLSCAEVLTGSGRR